MRRQQNEPSSLPMASPAKRARKANTTRTEEYVCGQCQASFPSVKRLNEHTKRTHMADPADRTCPHCQRMFENSTSVPRHVRNCPQKPSTAIQCIVPLSNVPSSPTAPYKKARSPKKSYVAVERYLVRLEAFLETGDFTYTNESRLEPLANATITGYKSFIRKFLEALVQGLIVGHGEGKFCSSFPFFYIVSIILN